MRACARMWIAFAFVCAPAQAQPEHGASVASAAPIREGPILPWYVAPDAPTIGVFDIVLGEPFAATVARSTFPFRPESGLGGEYADGVAEVRLRWGDRVYDAGRVTDLGWYVIERDGAPSIKAIDFSHQDGMLELREAMGRARALQAWLVQAGFTPGGPPEADERPDFSLIHPYRYDERAASWEEAEALLASSSEIHGFDLYRMRSGDWYATVTLISYARSGQGPPLRNPGREWNLQVGFNSELEPPLDIEDEEP